MSFLTPFFRSLLSYRPLPVNIFHFPSNSVFSFLFRLRPAQTDRRSAASQKWKANDKEEILRFF